MGTSSEQHYSLRWNDYTVKIVTAFQSLRDEEDFVDVTVACDGHHYSAHKMVLSACSPYFRSLLKVNPCRHPIVILKDVGHTEMEKLLEFMYNGEVNIAQDQLAAFLKTAESLKIRGLAGSSDDLDQSQLRDPHNYSSCLSVGTGISGRNSPSASFNSSQDKDDDITTDGIFHTNSPSTKRRKRASGLPLTSHADNSTSQTDNLTGEGLIDSGSDRVNMSGDHSIDLEDDRMDRRELKSEPSDGLGDVYVESSDMDQSQHSEALPGTSGAVNNQDGLTHENAGGGAMWYPSVVLRPKRYLCPFCDKCFTNRQSRSRHVHQKHASGLADVSALMAIANAVQATAPSDRPIKCPLCQSIIKHARNLRRHVFKRHLPAAQRGEITEADVKNVLERKLKTITVTPLTEDELRQVQQRIRRRGMKTPRKLKGVAALPSDVNASHINESEITIRKLPQKRDKKDKTGMGLGVLGSDAPHEDILQEALAARDKDSDPQEEVMDLATSQQQLPPISVVVSHGTHTGVQAVPQPVSLTVTQPSGIHRLQSETLQSVGRLQTESPISLHRDLATMPPMAFEPQVSISESMTTYHTTSPSQGIPQSTSPSPVTGYIPGSYWSTPGMAGLPASTFQPHQSVFAPAHAEYFTAGMHMVRPSSLDRMSQHRRKPYQ